MVGMDEATATASGVGASPGRARGDLHVDVDDALDAIAAGRSVVLALSTSSPGDVTAIVRAAAVVTLDASPDCHAGIVARGSGVPAVVRLEGMAIIPTGLNLGGEFVPVGASLTVDGTTGEVTAAAAVSTVVGIQLAKASRMGMRSVETAEIEEAAGLVGDRYHGSKHRQLSVQSLSELADAEREFGQPIDPLLTRRNVTISHGDVPRRPGHRWTLGEVELEVVRDAAPCKMLDMEIGDGARTVMRRRAGVICRVISGGTLTLGDAVDLRPISED